MQVDHIKSLTVQDTPYLVRQPRGERNARCSAAIGNGYRPADGRDLLVEITYAFPSYRGNDLNLMAHQVQMVSQV